MRQGRDEDIERLIQKIRRLLREIDDMADTLEETRQGGQGIADALGEVGATGQRARQGARTAPTQGVGVGAEASPPGEDVGEDDEADVLDYIPHGGPVPVRVRARDREQGQAGPASTCGGSWAEHWAGE